MKHHGGVSQLQKLVTIPLYANNLGYKEYVGVPSEHLAAYLQDGWRVV